MEKRHTTHASHKAWRRIAKKERRRRLRRKAAQEREADDERLRAALERSAEYLNWLQQQEKEEREREAKEEAERVEREKQWLEDEVRAQKEWRILQEQKEKERQERLKEEERIRQEFEAKQEAIRKKKEEARRRREEEIKKRQELQRQFNDYVDNGIKTPEALREVIDSQPGKELCPFFTKTGACRYGDSCSRNHRRVCLSNVILVPGFYSHFSLEKNSAEYDTDIGLEFESSEMREHFYEFYKDVVPELESFGRIKTLKYCRNTEIHLRGNLYVEYYTEREAARALRRLKGRWYAGKQLNCEFANIQSWRSAICGMSKCPKGRACNFLHTFKNPNDQYDIKSPPRWARSSNSQDSSNSRRSEHRTKSRWEESIRGGMDEPRNWRWSESPEIELDHRSSDPDRNRRQSEDRSRHRRSRHDSRHRDSSDRRDDSDRSHSRSSKNTESTESHRRSSSSRSRKRTIDNIRNGNDSSDEENYESSSRRRDVKYRRKRRERNGDDYDHSKSSHERKRSRSTSDSRRHERENNSRKHSKSKTDNNTTKEEISSHKSRNSSKSSSEIDRSQIKDKTIDRLNDLENVDKTERTQRKKKKFKTKWDSEQLETSDSPDSCNSDSSVASPLRKQPIDSDDQIGDAWATTETEPDDNDLSDKEF